MNIKVSSIIKFLMTLLILMNLSYFKLFGNQIELFSTSYTSKPLGMLYLLLICTVLAFTIFYYLERLSSCLVAEVLCVLVGAIAGMTKVGDFAQAVCDALPYIYILLAIPVLVMLSRGHWELNNLVKQILIFTLGSYGIRAYISIMYTLTGTTVLPNIAREAAMENWIRNDVLRVNPPCFALVFAPLAFYFFITSYKLKDRLFGLICMVISVLYHVFVSQARSMMIYNVLVLVIMSTFQRTNDKKKMLRISMLILGVLILVNTSYFNELLDSFSVNNSDTGGSTMARFNAISYFGALYSNNVLTGLGYINESTPIGGNISDIGFLYSIFRLGIPLLLFYIVVFIRGLTIYWKVRLVDAEKAILVLGMTVLIMMTGINIDCFTSIFAFAVPFYVAIIEYIDYEVKCGMEELGIES